MRAHFKLREPFTGPSLKAVRTLVIRPFQGYGNAAPLSYPDTWVRKPDLPPLTRQRVLWTLGGRWSSFCSIFSRSNVKMWLLANGHFVS